MNNLSKKIYISTPFFHIKGNAPNVGSSSYSKKLDIYYRCIVVFFASARRFHNDAKLILFTNAKLPEEYSLFLEKYQVSQIILDNENIKYADNSLFKNNFPGCLFALDVINFCADKNFLDDDSVLFMLDSDCIFLKSLEQIATEISQQQKISGIPLEMDADYNMNGQTKKSLSSIAFEFKNNVGIIEFYGGEFYGLSNLMIKKISEDIKNFANYIKLNPSYGNTFTEEHILSVIYALNKEKILDKNQIIKRVWTADTYTNIDDSENLYTILHYPAEKKKFFKKIYQNLQKNYDFFRDKSEDELKKIALSPIYKRLNPGLLNRIIIFAKTYIKKKLSVIKK